MINMKRDMPRTLKSLVSDYMCLLLTSDHSLSGGKTEVKKMITMEVEVTDDEEGERLTINELNC